MWYCLKPISRRINFSHWDWFLSLAIATKQLSPSEIPCRAGKFGAKFELDVNSADLEVGENDKSVKERKRTAQEN